LRAVCFGHGVQLRRIRSWPGAMERGCWRTCLSSFAEKLNGCSMTHVAHAEHARAATARGVKNMVYCSRKWRFENDGRRACLIYTRSGLPPRLDPSHHASVPTVSRLPPRITTVLDRFGAVPR
jgi:hypothetical protein